MWYCWLSQIRSSSCSSNRRASGATSPPPLMRLRFQRCGSRPLHQASGHRCLRRGLRSSESASVLSAWGRQAGRPPTGGSGSRTRLMPRESKWDTESGSRSSLDRRLPGPRGTGVMVPPLDFLIEPPDLLSVQLGRTSIVALAVRVHVPPSGGRRKVVVHPQPHHLYRASQAVRRRHHAGSSSSVRCGIVLPCLPEWSVSAFLTSPFQGPRSGKAERRPAGGRRSAFTAHPAGRHIPAHLQRLVAGARRLLPRAAHLYLAVNTAQPPAHVAQPSFTAIEPRNRSPVPQLHDLDETAIGVTISPNRVGERLTAMPGRWLNTTTAPGRRSSYPARGE